MHWRSFAIGAVMMCVLAIGAYSYLPGQNKAASPAPNPSAGIPADAVTIIPLPPLRILSGNEVPFEGKAEFRQVLAGRFAKGVHVVRFQASGEHADKSVIKIVWENGEVDMVYPATQDRQFPPEKRASAITVSGYSMHERKVFKDSGRKGSLTWEIRYEPVDL